MRRFLVPLSLTLVSLLPAGCVALAGGAAAGFLISQEVLPNSVHTATVSRDVETVWTQAQGALGRLSSEPMQVTEFPRTAVGQVEGTTVTVKVHAYDLDLTVISVEAERFLVSRGEVARRVLDTILDQMN